MLVAEMTPGAVALAQAARVETPLQQAEEQLKMLLLTDTENHPDVIAQKKLIAFLKTQRSPHRSHCRDASEGGRCPPGRC